MNRRLRLVVAAATLLWVSASLPVGAVSPTYTYTGMNFTTVGGSYTTSTSITGFITTASALAPSTAVNDASVPQTWSFTDGVQTLTETTSTMAQFNIVTDASGDITTWSVIIYDGTTAPTAGGNVSGLEAYYASGTAQDAAWRTGTCGSPSGGVCSVSVTDADEYGLSYVAGSWATSGVPTLPELGFWLLTVLLLTGGSYLVLRRRPDDSAVMAR